MSATGPAATTAVLRRRPLRRVVGVLQFITIAAVTILRCLVLPHVCSDEVPRALARRHVSHSDDSRGRFSHGLFLPSALLSPHSSSFNMLPLLMPLVGTEGSLEAIPAKRTCGFEACVQDASEAECAA